MKIEKYTGKVVWFDAKKGYGFISRPNEQDLFVYWSDIDPESVQGFRTLKKGQTVAFSIGLNKRSQPKATDVVVISEAEE